MGELRGNVAAADDDQAFGQLGELEGVLVGEVFDALETANGRDQGTGARGDENGLPADGLALHLEGALPGEPRLACVKIQVLGLLQGPPHRVVALLHVPAHARHDRREINVRDLRRDPELARLPDLHDPVRGIDKLLCRDASHVEAGPSHRPLFNEGEGLSVLEHVADQVGPRAGADDDHVIFLHGEPSFPRSAAAPFSLIIP
jgi:hypothetical protein